MKRLRLLSIITLVALLAPLVLAGCGGKKEEQVTELHFFNWSEYIDPQIYDDFEKEYGIHVVEDTFASNEDLLSKLQAGATGYDVIVPSDYMVAMMIELGLLAELDKDNLPNISNLAETFTNPPYDPGLVHCVPYMWGTTGIGFDWDYFDEPPDSWSYLFDPDVASQYAGYYSLLNDPTEVIGAALIYLGYSPNDRDPAHIEEAKNVIIAIKPYVHTFDSEQFEDLLSSEEIHMAHGWSGDIFMKQVEDESVDYVIPKEGAIIWADNLCIPKSVDDSPARKKAAELWINYLMRADVAGKNTNYVWYASPNQAAEEYIDQEILEHPGIYPSAETWKRLTWSEPLGEAQALYDRAWTEIKSE